MGQKDASIFPPATAKVRRQPGWTRPYLVNGPSPCTDSSIIFRNLCASGMDPGVVKERRIKTEILLRFGERVC